MNCAAAETPKAVALPADNPFAAPSPLPFQAPAFDKIKIDVFMPTFTAGMQQQLGEMQTIAGRTDAPTFINTIVPMEESGAVLIRVSNVFDNLCSADKNEPLQNLETELAPLRAAHSDNLLLNRPLFQRVEKLWETKDSLGLTEEQAELLKQRYESFVRAGAKLNDEQQGRIRSLNEQLSRLETKFEENLLAVSKERAVVVDTAEELDGMSAADIAAAAELAKARGLEGKYLLQISNTTRVPVLISLNNRALRQRVWEASAYRGLGRNNGIDNRPLVLEIAQLRAERAALLGYANHAAYKLQNQMAKTPAAARKMLTDLVPGVVERVHQEAHDLEAMIKQCGESHELAPWDWEYYAEKVRKARFEVDEAAVRPYFELDNVLKNGVFFTMNKLYGISYRERHDLPVYHPDVRVFDVLDKDGSQLGLFYADYFKRDTKRGGAWMSSFVDQSKLLHQQPVIVNCLNIPRPADGEPALLSFDNVRTLFHEMGHALHGMFSDVTYPTVSGTATPRDFVEFPSTFEEDWSIQPEILANYAKHYQTGAPIPADLLDKVIKANKFNQGFQTLEYMSAALLDLEWHTLTSDQVPADVEQFEKDALERLGVAHPAVPPRYKSAYFAHIWGGGYSASYYAYLWSEVLAADAFAHMLSHGGCTRANGESFREEILSRGSSRDPMKSYKAFRGAEPTVEALLVRRGLK
ncbi:MAG: M3 family metallopeptidase [Planctomycetaceae bacterium]